MIQSLGGKFVKIGEGDATMYSVKYGRESYIPHLSRRNIPQFASADGGGYG